MSLAYTKWDCKYHMVLIPKYRYKVFFAKSRKRVGEMLRELCLYKGIILWLAAKKRRPMSRVRSSPIPSF
ncbi:MAG: hypothetical protein GY777_28555 [Candidatus Brocadiaceae bacterium]|nr:hypothetical protein [Candidatus Brocadiaceae bacterium]